VPHNVIDLKDRIPKRYFNIDVSSFGAIPPDDFLYRLEKLLFRPYLYSIQPAEVVLLDPDATSETVENRRKAIL